MRLGLLRSIHGRLAGFVGGLPSWGHWQLDQLSDIPMWKSGDVVDLVVPFDKKCAKNLQEFLDPGVLFKVVDYLIL
jgi:hypothetical protein